MVSKLEDLIYLVLSTGVITLIGAVVRLHITNTVLSSKVSILEDKLETVIHPKIRGMQEKFDSVNVRFDDHFRMLGALLDRFNSVEVK